MINNPNKNTKTKNLTLCSDAERASIYVARQIADVVIERQKQGKQAVLGLATGNTPVLVYRELIRMHKNEGLSFRNVISFNLDEYYPICPKDDQSYTHFMHYNLFNHIDIDPQNIHIPHADCAPEEIGLYCTGYEEKIMGFGGLDLQLLGIGRNGHIGFNEPGSSFESTTRLVDLHPLTRNDAQVNFGALESVPHQAISVGIHTIIQARKILLLAIGEQKSEIIRTALKGDISIEVPASLLQILPQVEYILDEDAALLIK